MNNQILPLTKKLLRIPSTKDNPDELETVLTVCQDELKGFKIKAYESNGIKSLLVTNSPSEKYKVILNAHIDVVPAKKGQFTPVEKDGKLYGRGAYDMKAATAVMILIFNELAHKVTYPLALQIVTDEEIGGLNGTKYQVNQGIKAEFVIAGENTNLALKDKAKGILWVEIIAKGKSAHGAKPWLGENAIEHLTKTLEKLQSIFPNPTSPTWQTTVNVATIQTSNTAFNKIPDEAKASLDIRYIPEDKEKLLSHLQDLSSNSVEIITVVDEPAMSVNINDSFMISLSQIIQEVTGKQTDIMHGHGASDVRFYTEKGMPATEFGPIGGGDHEDSEWVDIESLGNYYEILKKFLLSLS